jgi:hypothetical protein
MEFKIKTALGSLLIDAFSSVWVKAFLQVQVITVGLSAPLERTSDARTTEVSRLYVSSRDG